MEVQRLGDEYSPEQWIQMQIINIIHNIIPIWGVLCVV